MCPAIVWNNSISIKKETSVLANNFINFIKSACIDATNDTGKGMGFKRKKLYQPCVYRNDYAKQTLKGNILDIRIRTDSEGYETEVIFFDKLQML